MEIFHADPAFKGSDTITRSKSDPFPFFVDRPPMWDGLPSQARHLADVFPEWWAAQTSRGWPVESNRAVAMWATVGSSEISPRAYTYLASEPLGDCVTALTLTTIREDEPPNGRKLLLSINDEVLS